MLVTHYPCGCRTAFCVFARRRLYAFGIVITVAVAGCSSTGPLHPPCRSCMIAPAKLESVRKGEDAIALAAAYRAQYVKISARLRALQGYVKTVTQ